MKTKSRFLLVASLLAMVALGLFVSQDESQQQAPVASLQPDLVREPESIAANHIEPDSAAVPVASGQISARQPVSPAFVSALEAIQEVGFRLSEQQLNEASNEQQALLESLNRMSEQEKLAFAEFFIEFIDSNPINPDAIVAFSELWGSMELTESARTAAAMKLAPQFLSEFEFMLAIEQYQLVETGAGTLTAQQQSELAQAKFAMSQYADAIPLLQEFMNHELLAGRSVERIHYSRLFESYFRLGDFAQAEAIGLQLLRESDDIQDWKDMEQFYLATDNDSGVAAHLLAAYDKGLLDAAGNWVR